MRKIIGITGGIGTGKSTVSAYLKEQGYPVIDADQIARKVTEKGSATLAELARNFGSGILDRDGGLDRRRMAELAFSSPEKKARLEAIVTSRVIAETAARIRELRQEDGPVAFLDAPTLYETGSDVLVDEVWLVTADESVRVRRAADRDGCSEAEIRRRIRSQMSEEEKRYRADYIIDNSDGLEQLYIRIRALIKKHD